MNIKERFPSLNELMPVYSIAVVYIYGYSIVRFLWRLPSLLNYAPLGEIGVTFSYLMVVTLFESILVVSVPIFLGFILPKKWFRDRFVSKGGWIIVLGLGYLTYISSQIIVDAPFPYSYFRWSPLVFFIIFGVVLLFDRINFLTKAIETVADKFVVFLFISMPISLVSLLVVIIRNIV